MKRKIISLSILALLTAFYLAFLFILPKCIDLNKYSPEITRLVQDNTGIQAELKNLKLKTSWNLSAGALIDQADLKYNTGEKFAQINNLRINISLIRLLFKTLKINRIEADKILANIDEAKIKTAETYKCNSKKQKFTPKINSINIKKYRISVLKGTNNYTVKGSDLKISDFVLNKKIKVKTNGDLILNGRKQITYNILIASQVFKKNKNYQNEVNKILDDLYKYNICSDINTNLKIKENDTDGKINIKGLSFVLGNKIFPPSNLDLEFQGDKAKINSTFYNDLNSKVIISGWFNAGKYKHIDLHVISDKINLENLMLIAKTFKLKQAQELSAKGFVKADFDLKSDFKKVQSRGHLTITDANIVNLKENGSLTLDNAHIDFSENNIKINPVNAKLNGEPILIKGLIDKNANADITILANNLKLKDILVTSGNTKVLKENNIDGVINIKAYLQGRLDKAKPKINIILSNLSLINKASQAQIRLDKINLNTLLGDKDLLIPATPLYINNIKTTLSGKISGIDSKPYLNSLQISIPNQISVPVKGYPNSNMVLKGNLLISGNLDKPQINGGLSILAIKLPSISTSLKNVSLDFGKTINLNCEQIQISDSIMNLKAEINNDISKGIVAKNVILNSPNLNLNSLLSIYKTLPRNSTSNFIILNGHSLVNNFKVGGINTNNINTDISFTNNVLYLKNLIGNAYFGKIGGNISYALANRKTSLDLQGRGLSSNSALIALTGRDDDIHGQLDFDSDVSFIGYTKKEITKSLKGYTNFIISNGKMGMLGKFEHLIYAQNVLSCSIFKTSLNLVAKAVMVKNTGVYKYMKGNITLSDGWANINWIKTSGPSMSLYITGRYYLPDNIAQLTMLGRISDDVVKILGPIGEFSMNKVISSIPKMGPVTSLFASQFTTNPSYENTSQIPPLNPKTEFATREFKVIIDGDTQSQSAVKSFKWLAKPQIIQEEQKVSEPPEEKVPDFVNNLPDLKN